MRFERLADRIEYCFKHGEDCLDERLWEFVCDMKERLDKYKDACTLTPKQHGFLGSCFKRVITAHPLANESTLERMKRKKADLIARTAVSVKAKNKRRMDAGQITTVGSVSPHQLLMKFEETGVTAVARAHGTRAQRVNARIDVRTAIKQSGRKKR